MSDVTSVSISAELNYASLRKFHVFFFLGASEKVIHSPFLLLAILCTHSINLPEKMDRINITSPRNHSSVVLFLNQTAPPIYKSKETRSDHILCSSLLRTTYLDCGYLLRMLARNDNLCVYACTTHFSAHVMWPVQYSNTFMYATHTTYNT